IGAAINTNIFISDGNSHAGPLTLKNGGTVIGQGANPGQTFAQFFGINTPAQGTLPVLPSLNQARPTVSALSGTTITVAQNNALRGFDLGNSNTAGTALAGTSFGTLTLGD